MSDGLVVSNSGNLNALGDPHLEKVLRRVYGDLALFSRHVIRSHPLREYQLAPARAIVESVRRRLGLQFAVVFCRQAGKDEMLAQLEAFLLNLFQLKGGSIVLAAPTYKPQSLVSRQRLLERLDNGFNHRRYAKKEGYIVSLGKASCRFLSAGPGANARGETASLLLLCNEAQDVLPEQWDAVFDPMAASTNATTVFAGTVWTSRTLLARQVRYLRELEKEDGRQRVYLVDWQRVAGDLPAYGQRVRERIHQFGRQHPFIKTEYFLEEIDGDGGMFPPHRQAQMRGQQPRQTEAAPGHMYALLLDVAGECEQRGEVETFEPGSIGTFQRSGRDSTALTVVEIDLTTLSDDLLLKPAYRVVDRRLWTGTKHSKLYGALVDLARQVWKARFLVVDATGVGAGLASFLQRALGDQVVVPFIFSGASKTRLGWDFLAICDTGRFKDHLEDGSHEQRLFWKQVEECTYEIQPGPEKRMKWGVEKGHDDLLLSAALCALLDGLDWRPRRAKGVRRLEG